MKQKEQIEIELSQLELEKNKEINLLRKTLTEVKQKLEGERLSQKGSKIEIE